MKLSIERSKPRFAFSSSYPLHFIGTVDGTELTTPCAYDVYLDLDDSCDQGPTWIPCIWTVDASGRKWDTKLNKERIQDYYSSPLSDVIIFVKTLLLDGGWWNVFADDKFLNMGEAWQVRASFQRYVKAEGV